MQALEESAIPLPDARWVYRHAEVFIGSIILQHHCTAMQLDGAEAGSSSAARVWQYVSSISGHACYPGFDGL